MSLKQTINDDVKTALRGGDKDRTTTLRMILAAIKQVEVDERKELTDKDVITILSRMVKQRKESIEQYTKGGREDLAEKEQQELTLIQTYLPEQLSDDEVDAMVEQAIAESGAASIKDMGKVMAALKPKLQGRADMGAVSGKVKSKLGS
jgi:uncharacterized protein YqeY